MRHAEKRHHLLEKLGAHLKGQRQAVFRETHEQFAARLSLYGVVNATASMVAAMEAGAPDISIEHWLCAWQAMQVADGVVLASKSDAALFLAAAQAAPGIEEEMAAELNGAADKREAP